jgi:hypothetical protein
MNSDRRHRLTRFKWLLVGLGVFLLSAVLSWGELEYTLLGKTAEADVTEVRDVVESQRRSDQLLIHVEYSFPDGDGLRHESDRVPVSWPRPSSGGRIRVQYLPGRPHGSRLEGHRNLAPLALLVVSLGAVTGFVIPQIRGKPRSIEGSDA